MSGARFKARPTLLMTMRLTRVGVFVAVRSTNRVWLIDGVLHASSSCIIDREQSLNPTTFSHLFLSRLRLVSLFISLLLSYSSLYDPIMKRHGLVQACPLPAITREHCLHFTSEQVVGRVRKEEKSGMVLTKRKT